MSDIIKVGDTTPLHDPKTDPDLTVLKEHTFTVITDGITKTVRASAMGPTGTGEAMVAEPAVKAPEQPVKPVEQVVEGKRKPSRAKPAPIAKSAEGGPMTLTVVTSGRAATKITLSQDGTRISNGEGIVDAE